MDDAQKKLAALLPYWIEHNQEHEKEFRDWANTVSTVRRDVADLLVQAAIGMSEATTWLERARQGLKRG